MDYPEGASLQRAGVSGISCAGGHCGNEGAPHGPTESPARSRRAVGPAPGRRGRQDGLRCRRPARQPEEGADRAGAERRDGPPPRRCRGRRQPQRLRPQDGDHRRRQDGAGDSARPAGQLRPPADRQVPAALPRLRREDHLDVRPGHERARDRRPSARALRRRRIARPDRHRHRRRARGGRGLAGPAARARVFAGVLRRSPLSRH